MTITAVPNKSLPNRSLPKALKLAFAAGALAMLGACTTTFDTRVQSFQAMPQFQGQSFYIVPTDDKRSGSLEFQSYAALVSAELQAAGMVQANSVQNAAFVVTMDFGSGPPRDRLGTRPAMTGSSWGWWGSPWGPWGRPFGWGSFYDPWGPGHRSEVYAYTQYPAFLQIGIVRQSDRAPLFEGRAESNTRVNDLPAHMPKLVTAMFTDFPGPPTRSQVVRVPIN